MGYNVFRNHQWEFVPHSHRRYHARNHGALVSAAADVSPTEQPLPMPFVTQAFFNFAFWYPVVWLHNVVRIFAASQAARPATVSLKHLLDTQLAAEAVIEVM